MAAPRRTRVLESTLPSLRPFSPRAQTRPTSPGAAIAEVTPQSPGPITTLLGVWSRGDRTALDALLPLVHAELKRIARRHLSRERADHTIQPTALVNEAFVRLVNERGMQWQDRAHFLAVAAHLMRFILVDYARRRHMQRRGGERRRVDLDTALEIADPRPIGILAVDDALSRLATLDERKARVVEMRVFAGLTVDQSAQVLGISAVTVARDWRFAKAWLKREIVR